MAALAPTAPAAQVRSCYPAPSVIDVPQLPLACKCPGAKWCSVVQSASPPSASLLDLTPA